MDNSIQQSQPVKLRMPQIFIGKNYEKIVHNKFSFTGFFFGGIYFLYRKMYLYGTLLYLINLVLTLLLPEIIKNTVILVCIYLIFSLIIGFITNRLYKNYVMRKLSKIKEKNGSYEESASMCRKQGGTNLLLAIVISVVMSMIFSIITSKLGFEYDSISNTTVEEYEYDNISNTTTEEKEYDGVVAIDDSVIISDVFDYTIPTEFEEGFMNAEYALHYEYATAPSEDLCKFSFFAVNEYKDASTLVNSMAKYFNATETIDTVNINGINWQTITYDFIGHSYVAAVDKGNRVFLVKYDIEENADISVCENYYSLIMNSISMK